ncbi:MAG: Gfo/Idh/MocA family oxidoreductase [Micrococcales bacterium]|nr:Gfo/Idh/MocA family oxidoreductase [Micrococcales bacterium]
MTSPAVIRLGVIGLGAVAQSVHLPLLRRRPELFAITAISDISPSLLASVGEVFGIVHSARYTDAFALLDRDDLDAILICSGGSHEPIVTAALERDLAVLCEKPLAFTHAELDRLRQVAPMEGPPRLMVGYMKQYDPATALARQLLNDIDDVRTVDVRVLHPTGQSQLDFAHLISSGGDIPDDTRDELRRTDRALWDSAFGEGDENEDLWRVYAGCLMSSLSHDMAVVRTLFAPITAVDFADIWRTSSRHQRRQTGRDAGGLGAQPPSIRAVGAIEETTRFTLDWHYLHDYPAYRETIKIIYGAGSLELAFPSPYLLHAPTVLTQYSAAGEAEARTEFRNIGESFEIQLEAFADMIHQEMQPLTDLVGAEHDVDTSQAIVASYAERMGIPLGGELDSEPSRARGVTA